MLSTICLEISVLCIEYFVSESGGGRELRNPLHVHELGLKVGDEASVDLGNVSSLCLSNRFSREVISTQVTSSQAQE